MLRSLKFFMSKKKIIFGREGMHIITQTAQEVAKVAAITLGPMGRNVVIQNDKHLPRITKDGVTVVKHIEYVEDRLKDAVCTLIKKSVNSTNKFAGDGTTTSSLLIGSILKAARKYLEAGYKPRQIKQGLKIGRNLGIDFIKMASQPINTKQEYYRVAMIATKGDEMLSKLISEAVQKTQLIKVQKTQKTQSYIQYLSGVKMVAGIPHPQFKNIGDKVQLDYPLVLLSKKEINRIQDIVNALQIARKARKQLLIVSNKISDSVLSNLIYNKRKNIVEAYPLLLQGYGTITQSYLQQLSKATGAILFDQYSPCKLADVQYEHLGRARRVEMDQIETTVYGTAEKDITNAVVYAGGSTEEVGLQVYDKIIDALNSVQTAKKNGVVAGGGVMYWRMSEMLESYQGDSAIGVRILSQALKQPRITLVKSLADYYNCLKGSGWQGYNFKTGKIQDMFEVGIVDSATVGESVLIDSISLASLLIDIEVSIVRLQKNVEQGKEVQKIQQSYRI